MENTLQPLSEEVGLIRNLALSSFQALRERHEKIALQHINTCLLALRRLKPKIKRYDFSACEDVNADDLIEKITKIIAVMQLVAGILQKIPEAQKKAGTTNTASLFNSAYKDMAIISRSLVVLATQLDNASCPTQQVEESINEVRSKESRRLKQLLERRYFYKILIVEDQYWPLEILKKNVFKLLFGPAKVCSTPRAFHSKHTLDTAKSYAEARDLIKKQRYDLVLLDHRMPLTNPGFRDIDNPRPFSDLLDQAQKKGIGGYALIPLIKKRNPRAIIIGTSSLTHEITRFPPPDYTIDKNEAAAGLEAIFGKIFSTSPPPATGGKGFFAKDR